jgi:predicted O-methyltransferase YrrM
MTEFLKEIIRAKRKKKSLPGLFALLSYYPKWSFFQKHKDVYKNAIPWITFEAIAFLQGYLSKSMKVFEYGGGGSTLFFAKRVGELVTVEHNSEWYDGLVKEMAKITSINWKPNLIRPEKVEDTANLKIENPLDYFSDDENFRQHTFHQYASVIDQYPDDYFDVILIDGRVRPSCLLHSLKKVNKGGLLILDNADRTYYLKAFNDKLNNFQLLTNHVGPTPYLPWFTQTNIWKRVN